MRYELELDIDLPRQRVVEIFLDPADLPHWQPDLIHFEMLGDSTEYAVGTQTRQIHRMGKSTVEMIETITVCDPPEHFAATYEADGVWNLVETQFTEPSEGRTHWHLVSDFQCKGIVIRLMTIFAPGMFKRQTMTFMQRFKEFAEQKDA